MSRKTAKNKIIQLSKLKLHYEDVVFKLPKKRLPSVWQDVKVVVKWAYSLVGNSTAQVAAHKLGKQFGTLSRRAVSVYKALDHQITVKDAILILLGLLLVWTLFFRDHVIAEPLPVKKPVISSYKPLKQSKLKKQSTLAKKVTKPVYKPVVARSVPVSSGCVRISTTGDANLDWIMARESGGNSCARNPSSGACGLFQELPCGKSGCSLSNTACQIAWARSYCIARYGSTAGAVAFWQANGWY